MTHPADPEALESLVGFWLDTGMIDAREAQALGRMGQQTAPKAPPPRAPRSNKPPPPRLRGRNPVAEARQLAEAAASLESLKKAIESFDGCELRRGARNTVVCDGAYDADIMLIGEGPGGEEDAKGLPFVGRSGRLQDKILASIGVRRTQNLFISNLVYWRPPGNRDPDPEELAICAPFVQRMIELKAPKLILASGRFSAHSLLGVTDGIMRLRGRKMTYSHEGLSAPIPCVPLLHPAYLLRRPADKAKAWADMQTIAKLCDELGVKREAPL